MNVSPGLNPTWLANSLTRSDSLVIDRLSGGADSMVSMAVKILVRLAGARRSWAPRWA